jgi:hypothetical protein
MSVRAPFRVDLNKLTSSGVVTTILGIHVRYFDSREAHLHIREHSCAAVIFSPCHGPVVRAFSRSFRQFLFQRSPFSKPRPLHSLHVSRQRPLFHY